MERMENRHEREDEERQEGEGTPEERPETDGSERQEAVERKEMRMEEETGKETELAKEQVAEAVWRRPVDYIGDVFSEKLVPYVKRFLEKFGSLDDEALPDASMREARDKARDVTERE